MVPRRLAHQASGNFRAMSNPATFLARVGQALYGQQYQRAVAATLGVSDRTVRYWLAGRHQIPRGVWVDLVEVAKERRAEITAITKEIAAVIARSADP